MYLFKNDKRSNLQPIKEQKIPLEKDMQNVVENNLEEIFGFDFVSSEFTVDNFRIDTFAYNPDTNSFIVIEYKKDRSFSVVDQWYTYLSLLMNNQAEFILEYNQKKNKSLNKKDINREATRVFFVANSFNKYQKQAINFKDLPIELWECRKFEDNIYSFDKIRANNSNISIKNLWGEIASSEVVDNIKTYSVRDHIREDREKSKSLYEEFNEKVLSLDNRIEESPQKIYIWYKIWTKVVCGLNIHKNKIKLGLNRVKPEDLKDPEWRVEYKENSYRFYNKHLSHFEIHSSEDIDYAIFLIKQVISKTID